MTLLKISALELVSDLTTPVSVFLKLREHFSDIVLLESSDYSGESDSLSYIAFESLYTMKKSSESYIFEDKINGTIECDVAFDAVSAMDLCLKYTSQLKDSDYCGYLGWFGYTSFDMTGEFENLPVKIQEDSEVPLWRYDFFRYVLVFDHFYESLYMIECFPESGESGLRNILSIISRQDHQTYAFKTQNDIQSNMTDTEFMKMVDIAKSHCQRGDVFQMVLSRSFKQTYSGDEFQVYRALRSINPSPYLFYFDYSSYKIFGSSPETQLTTKNGIAEIHPIAGTYRRTGNDLQDARAASDLANDPKENAEHTMLVDLARNDLSKSCRDVTVVQYKEIQYFSHVIHLVSRVQGQIKEKVKPYQVFADTFPAGTLSGAPKRKALQLIHKYETQNRMMYGGGLGIVKLNGDIQHAIIIRSFFCHHNTLHWQAGAGIVISSLPENENQEVYHKLGALRKAIEKAEMMSI
jgi:anthranilate synthase component 1